MNEIKKIKLFADGLQIDEFDKDYGINLDGYTFNPSIFRKNGAKNYIDYSKKILLKSKNKPVSLEVFADDPKGMIQQALKLDSLAKNVFVKIPIIYTSKKYTSEVIKELINKKIKLNITAIFTLEQIKEIIPIVKNTQTILSIFAGRIFDCGIDANESMKRICDYVNKNSTCETLWASPRMPYDYLSAQKVGSKIITMQLSQIKKLAFFGKNLEEYSMETVKQFYTDAKKSGFSI